MAEPILPAEVRLEASYRDYVRQLMQERPGWFPAATPQARAATWNRFALWCDELLKVSSIPPIFRNIDIEHISPRMPRNFRLLASELVGLLDAPRLIAVGGPRGTGKTMLASGLIRMFCQCGRSALYRTTKCIMDDLGGAPWEEKGRIRDIHRRQKLLVLDEVQTRDAREWQDNELVELIDSRYRDGLSTVLISNLEPGALKDNLGDSIWRRMVETGGLPIETDWPPLSVYLEELKNREPKGVVA